jgi:pimeloyl-ACP methyl ester carboxylesterase
MPNLQRLSMIGLCLAPLAVWPLPVAAGTSGEATATLGDTSLDVFTYRPSGCTLAGLLLVFHGLNRNASTYRDDARPLADRFCLLAAAPLFDITWFPTWRYQHGGIVKDGTVRDSALWTGWFVVKLADWLRQREAKPDMPYWVIGHSAGAQFLSRFAAFIPNQARRIVIANPSTWMLPSLADAPPYGFRGVPSAETLLRRYLAAPVTVFVGQEDTGSKNLVENEEAEAQGGTRFARGETTFHQAEAVAREHGWPFNWRLVEVPGVGHSARTMFGSPEAGDALGVPGP